MKTLLSLQKKFSFCMRKKRAERIKDLIRAIYAKYGFVRIADVGGTKEYWEIIDPLFLIRYNVHITVINKDASLYFDPTDGFGFIQEDARSLYFPDDFFHIAHSNSVIEHVGSLKDMSRFAVEINRIAESYYVQTPNYWFPIESHFFVPGFQWLPKRFRIWLNTKFNLGQFEKADRATAEENVNYCKLLTRMEVKTLFPDAKHYREWFLGFIKSHVLIKKSVNIKMK